MRVSVLDLGYTEMLFRNIGYPILFRGSVSWSFVRVILSDMDLLPNLVKH